MEKNVKKRHFGVVIYPESIPSNWLEYLRDSGLKIAISPLHDKDINESTGEIKKSHYHVIISYDGPVTISHVKKFVAYLNCPVPIALESIRGAYRYLTHMDNPEKYQYNDKDILLLNGFDISNYVKKTDTEVLAIKKLIVQIINDNNINEYSDLIDYLLINDMSDEFAVACTNTIFYNNYLSSRRNKCANKKK